MIFNFNPMIKILGICLFKLIIIFIDKCKDNYRKEQEISKVLYVCKLYINRIRFKYKKSYIKDN